MGMRAHMSDSKNISEQIKKGLADVRDSASEAMHRSSAEAEKTHREVAGDGMTPGEKVTSAINEGKARLEAEADKAKRALRDNT